MFTRYFAFSFDLDSSSEFLCENQLARDRQLTLDVPRYEKSMMKGLTADDTARLKMHLYAEVQRLRESTSICTPLDSPDYPLQEPTLFKNTSQKPIPNDSCHQKLVVIDIYLRRFARPDAPEV